MCDSDLSGPETTSGASMVCGVRWAVTGGDVAVYPPFSGYSMLSDQG
jgi:hypothetical protein